MKKKLLGQFYSSEIKEELNSFKEIILSNSFKIFYEPFVGEGDLLFYYLDILKENNIDIIKKINNKEIYCSDIDKDNLETIKSKFKSLGIEESIINEIVFFNDSLKNNKFKDYNTEDIFVLTNPPYLYKVVAKKTNKDMSYYDKYSDLYEVALDLYAKYDGVWILPSNIYFSNHVKILPDFINQIEIAHIYNQSKFKDTDISITIFSINHSIKKETLTLIENNKEIQLNLKESKIYFEEIETTSEEIGYKIGILDTEFENYKTKLSEPNIEFIYNKELVSGNYNIPKLYKNKSFIIKLFDSVSEEDISIIKLEDFNHLQGKELYVNKISDRMFFQVFLKEENNHLNVENIQNLFNATIKDLRKKYNSMFLTNFKSVGKGFNRKRITKSQLKSILNKTLKELNNGT